MKPDSKFEIIDPEKMDLSMCDKAGGVRSKRPKHREVDHKEESRKKKLIEILLGASMIIFIACLFAALIVLGLYRNDTEGKRDNSLMIIQKIMIVDVAMGGFIVFILNLTD